MSAKCISSSNILLCEIKAPDTSNTLSIKSKFNFKNNEISISLLSNKSSELLHFTIDSAAQISILKPTKMNKLTTGKKSLSLVLRKIQNWKLLEQSIPNYR